MKELFDLICGKENLNPKEHRLSLARTGTRKVTFDWNTAVGSLNIREVSVLRTPAGENSPGGVGNEDAIKDLVETQGERVSAAVLYLSHKIGDKVSKETVCCVGGKVNH